VGLVVKEAALLGGASALRSVSLVLWRSGTWAASLIFGISGPATLCSSEPPRSRLAAGSRGFGSLLPGSCAPRGLDPMVALARRMSR